VSRSNKSDFRSGIGPKVDYLIGQHIRHPE
jgi:hypothetical protein